MDLEVGDDADEDEDGAQTRERPADDRTRAVEQAADAEQQRQQGEAEGVVAPEAPVAAVDHDLVEQQVRAPAQHAEAEQKHGEPPGGAADVAEVVHARERSIQRGGRVRTRAWHADGRSPGATSARARLP